MMKIFQFFIQMPLICIAKCPIDDKQAQVQVWRKTGDTVIAWTNVNQDT